MNLGITPNFNINQSHVNKNQNISFGQVNLAASKAVSKRGLSVAERTARVLRSASGNFEVLARHHFLQVTRLNQCGYLGRNLTMQGKNAENFSNIQPLLKKFF